MRTETRFGKRVKELRLERGWSQDQLAEIADITARTVQRVEKDQTRDGETLKAIAAAFDVAVRDLATDYRVAEAQPPTALMIHSAEDFRIVIQRAHHFFSYRLMVTLRTEIEPRVRELVDEIFADIWAIDPDEPELLSSYVESITGPIEELKKLGMSFFSVQQRRDVFVKGSQVGERIPMEDVTYGDFFLVPTWGCFRRITEGKQEPLHRFSSRCADAVNTLIDIVKRDLDASIALNAIYVMSAEGGSEAVRWCDRCFPPLQDGSRISWEDLQNITGFTKDQLTEIDAHIREAISAVPIESSPSEIP